MSSVEFAKTFAANADITQKFAKELLATLESTIKTSLESGTKFTVAGVTFNVKDIEARTGRNPSTGESIEIPAHKRVVVKATKSLKDSVN
jgi:DNA-binding protein HU-beta